MRWLHTPKYVSISFLFDGVTTTFLKADFTLAPLRQFSVLNSQFSILNSQFSILNSQFSC